MRQAERREKWQRVIEQQQVSGVSARRWCPEHGVSLQSFYAWRRRLAREEIRPGFVELLAPAAESGGLVLELGPWRLRLEPGFDEATLRRMLRLLTETA